MNNEIFFLGAGFSKAIDNNFPLLTELSKEISAGYCAEKESISMHYYNEIPEQYKNNIEQLLTFLSSNLPFKTDVQTSADDALYKDLKNRIVNYFDKIEKKNYGCNESKYDVLFQYIIKNKITTITLNYDLLLEKMFNKYKENSLHLLEYMYHIPINALFTRLNNGSARYPYLEKFPDIPCILKLHGSINWLYAGISQTDPIYCKSTPMPENKYLLENEQYLAEDLQPMIVPPVMDKTSIYNHTILKSLWRQAYKKILEAEYIYICGFSFPETDLSIRFLFQSALADKKKYEKNLEKIYVINTKNEKEKIKERYKNVFDEYKSKLDFIYCCDDSLLKFTNEILAYK